MTIVLHYTAYARQEFGPLFLYSKGGSIFTTGAHLTGNIGPWGPHSTGRMGPRAVEWGRGAQFWGGPFYLYTCIRIVRIPGFSGKIPDTWQV